MKETTRPANAKADAKSPTGADMRFIMEATTDNMIHSTVPHGQINRAAVHATVSEFFGIFLKAQERLRERTAQTNASHR